MQNCHAIIGLQLRAFESDVLVRGGVRETGDQAEARFSDAWADPVDKGELPDRRIDRPFVNGLLHLVQDCLAFPVVELDRLLLVQIVEIGVIAVDEDPALDDMRFEPGGGVAERAGAGLNDVFEGLLGEPFDEGGALDRPKLWPDANRMQIVEDRLSDVCVGRVAKVIACVKAFGVSRFGEQLLRFLRIVSRRGRLPEEFVMVRNDRIAGDQRITEVSASFVPSRSIAKLAARRTRSSCQGDFGSHWSGK